MILYRFRVWDDKFNNRLIVDDDVYEQVVRGELIENFHIPNEVYTIMIPSDSAKDPDMRIMFSDNREKIIEYVHGLQMGLGYVERAVVVKLVDTLDLKSSGL